MTAADLTTGTGSPAWQVYQAAERRIRDEYVAAVTTARREYELNTAPARTAYDHAERTAWLAYNHDSRRNWRAYQAATETGDDVPRPHPEDRYLTTPAASDRCACEVPAPRPTFTPHPETEE